jgi:hypothetical protein
MDDMIIILTNVANVLHPACAIVRPFDAPGTGGASLSRPIRQRFPLTFDMFAAFC